MTCEAELHGWVFRMACPILSPIGKHDDEHGVNISIWTENIHLTSPLGVHVQHPDYHTYAGLVHLHFSFLDASFERVWAAASLS